MGIVTVSDPKRTFIYPLTQFFGTKMQWIVFLIVGIIALVVFVKYEERQKAKKINEAFDERPSLPDTEYYDKFFKAQGVPQEIVVGIRKILQEQLNADLSRLNASDDLSKNIGFFFELDSMADVEIICALEECFSIKISDEEASNARTVQDIVSLVWRKAMNNKDSLD